MWFYDMVGAKLTKNSAGYLAQMVDGEVMTNEDGSVYIVVYTKRGEMIAREGDYIAVNKKFFKGFSVLRFEDLETPEALVKHITRGTSYDKSANE